VSVFKKLFKLAVVLLIANAIYNFVPVYYRYTVFKDGVRELALFGRQLSDEALTDRIMDLAAQHDVPLVREDVRVHHTDIRVEVDASYTEIIRFVPTYDYEWLFNVNVQ
jgi:hypothetical protein